MHKLAFKLIPSMLNILEVLKLQSIDQFHFFSFSINLCISLYHFACIATPLMHFYFALMDQEPFRLFVLTNNRLVTNCNTSNHREKTRGRETFSIRVNNAKWIICNIYVIESEREIYISGLQIHFLFLFFLLCTNATTQKLAQNRNTPCGFLPSKQINCSISFPKKNKENKNKKYEISLTFCVYRNCLTLFSLSVSLALALNKFPS